MGDKRVRPALRKGGRFDPAVTAERLDSLRELAGVEPKDVGSIIWPNQSPENAARSWYKRATQKTIDFSLAEIAVAVDYLADRAHRRGVLTAHILPGFPFIDLWVSVELERGKKS